ncbi:unnamed protein product [Aphanomyces euteiches]
MANNVPTLSVAARAANLSESMFKLSELMKLHDVFEQRGALTEKQFVTHFHSILESDSWTPSQISQLFMKIDANSDGSVDWDEFTNFIQLRKQQHNLLEWHLFPSTIMTKQQRHQAPNGLATLLLLSLACQKEITLLAAQLTAL